MAENLQELIEDTTLAFHGEDYDTFRAAAARLAMPLIAERDNLAAEIDTLKPAANAWNALFATIGALADLDEKPDAPKDERLNDYIRAWAAKQQECDKLAAELDRLRAQAERYRLDALRLAAKVDPEEFAAEWEAEIADLRTVREDLDNERAVRSRRELAVTRAIAKAKLYTHPGTNAGDHKVLSEMVEILEGGAK